MCAPIPVRVSPPYVKVNSPTYSGPVFVNLSAVVVIAPVQSGKWYGQITPLAQGGLNALIGPGHDTRAEFEAYALDLLNATDTTTEAVSHG